MSNFDKMSEAFAASLSFGGTEKTAMDYSLNPEDTLMTKHAGISIYQPTIDNVEGFVKKYLASECPKDLGSLPISVFLSPYSFDRTRQEYVNDASGQAILDVDGVQIEMPFLIVEGEMTPFDVIQMGGQRVPYSKENLFKIVLGIKNQKKKNGQNSGGAEFDPYKKVDEPVNPTSSVGFLGDLLRIQEQYSTRGSSGTMYMTAGAHLSDLIEKVASIKTTSEETSSKLEALVKSAVMSTNVEKFEKIANDVEAAKKETDRKFKKIYKKVKGIDWKDANQIENGTFISFPEFDGNEISMTSGIVISDYIDIKGFYKIPAVKVVISEDGRIRILSKSEKFICVESPDAKFKFSTVSLESLSKGDVVMAFNGDKAFNPSIVDDIKIRTLSTAWDNDGSYIGDEFSSAMKYNSISSTAPAPKVQIKCYHFQALRGHSDGADRFDSIARFIRIAELGGVKLTRMEYDEYIAAKAEEIGVDELTVSKVISRYQFCDTQGKFILATDPNTRMIKIKGVISKFLSNPKDLENMVNSAYTPVNEIPIFKTASENEYVEIRKVDPQKRTYDLNVKWTDRNEENYKLMNRSFSRIDELKLRSILKAIGFDMNKVSEATIKTDNENYVKMELPLNATPDNIAENGFEVGATKTMNKLKNVLFNKGLSTELVNDVVANIAHENLIGSPTNNAVKLITEKAAEAKQLANVFEKLAMERRSENMRNVAKVMVLSNQFLEKTAEVMNGAEYPSYISAAANIVSERALMEHLASELVGLNQAQFGNHNSAVHPSHVHGAVLAIDSIFNVASKVCDFCGIEKKAAEYPNPSFNPTAVAVPDKKPIAHVVNDLELDRIKEMHDHPNAKKASEDTPADNKSEGADGDTSKETPLEDQVLLSDETKEAIEVVSKQCFQLNRFWDRAVSVLNVDFSMPRTSEILHKNLAHKFPLLADDVNSILDKYNIKIDYAQTDADSSEYSSITDLFRQGLREILKLRLLAMEAKDVMVTNGDGDAAPQMDAFLVKLSDYIAQCITLKDKAVSYNGDAARFDRDIDKFFDRQKLASIFDEREPRAQESPADDYVLGDMAQSESLYEPPATAEQILTAAPESTEREKIIGIGAGRDMTNVKTTQRANAQRKLAEDDSLNALAQKLANLNK